MPFFSPPGTSGSQFSRIHQEISIAKNKLALQATQLASHHRGPQTGKDQLQIPTSQVLKNKCLSGFYILGPSDLARSATTDAQRFKPGQELPNQGLAGIHSKMLR